MGGADANVPMVFNGESAGAVTGGRFPAATWSAFTSAMLANAPIVPFIEPGPTRGGELLQPPIGSAVTSTGGGGRFP